LAVRKTWSQREQGVVSSGFMYSVIAPIIPADEGLRVVPGFK